MHVNLEKKSFPPQGVFDYDKSRISDMFSPYSCQSMLCPTSISENEYNFPPQ